MALRRRVRYSSWVQANRSSTFKPIVSPTPAGPTATYLPPQLPAEIRSPPTLMLAGASPAPTSRRCAPRRRCRLARPVASKLVSGRTRHRLAGGTVRCRRCGVSSPRIDHYTDNGYYPCSRVRVMGSRAMSLSVYPTKEQRGIHTPSRTLRPSRRRWRRAARYPQALPHAQARATRRRQGHLLPTAERPALAG